MLRKGLAKIHKSKHGAGVVAHEATEETVPIAVQLLWSAGVQRRVVEHLELKMSVPANVLAIVVRDVAGKVQDGSGDDEAEIGM